MAVDIRPRPSLRLWYGTSLAMARDGEPDLSLRQMTIRLGDLVVTRAAELSN